jgi:formylmethanofuran dehydrogenase subunit E
MTWDERKLFAKSTPTFMMRTPYLRDVFEIDKHPDESDADFIARIRNSPHKTIHICTVCGEQVEDDSFADIEGNTLCEECSERFYDALADETAKDIG